MTDTELIVCLVGRASFCSERGEVKSSEVMLKAAERITELLVDFNDCNSERLRWKKEREEAWKRAEHAENMWGSTEVTLTEAINILEDALQEAGDDYPGSTMQSWCQQQIKQARKVRGK